MFFHPFVDFRDFPDSEVMLEQLGMGIKLGLRNAVYDPSTNPAAKPPGSQIGYGQRISDKKPCVSVFLEKIFQETQPAGKDFPGKFLAF